MRVTQKDLARKLNLSQSLVTGVLNATPGVWASAETRQRILQAARDLNYQPHAGARALRSGKTHVVACVVTGAIGYNAVIEVLADRLAEIEYDLLIKVISQPEQANLRLRPLISGGICDAIVFWGEEREIEPLAQATAEAEKPFVVKGRFEESHPDWVQIEFDHEGMMQQTVEYLASLGHRRIGYLGHANDLIYTRKLQAGYEEAMGRLLAELPPAHFIRSIDSGWEAAEAAMQTWEQLPAAQRPTALAIGTELSTWHGIERWLAQRGQRIREEVGAFTLAGMAGNDAPLLYGSGYALREAEIVTLADTLGRRILPRLLRQEALDPPIMRLLPPLQPLQSLALPLPVAPVASEGTA